LDFGHRKPLFIWFIQSWDRVENTKYEKYEKTSAIVVVMSLPIMKLSTLLCNLKYTTISKFIEIYINMKMLVYIKVFMDFFYALISMEISTKKHETPHNKVKDACLCIE
jgi:hypothetical protein